MRPVVPACSRLIVPAASAERASAASQQRRAAAAACAPRLTAPLNRCRKGKKGGAKLKIDATFVPDECGTKVRPARLARPPPAGALLAG